MVCRVEDEEAGQIPMAYVVRAAGSQLTEDQVIQFVAAQVGLLLQLFYRLKMCSFKRPGQSSSN